MIIDSLLSLVAPIKCIGCGVLGHVLCGICLGSAGEPPPPRCVGCSRLSDSYKTCASCRSWIDIYAVFVSSLYEGMYEQLVHAYKFDLWRQAANPMAIIMRRMSIQLQVDGDLLIIPMPTAPARIRQRGFDHARLLAREYWRKLPRSVQDQCSVTDVLERRSNSRQLGSSREQRIRQVQSEFLIKDQDDIAGKTVLLIDDVTTTGASLAAAAKTLKQAGAKRVYAHIFAQKM